MWILGMLMIAWWTCGGAWPWLVLGALLVDRGWAVAALWVDSKWRNRDDHEP